MDDINTIVIAGRLTKDGELKYTNGQNPMAILNLSVAVNRSRKNGGNFENEASFFEVTLFGKRAESLAQYMVKGKQVAIAGSLRQERWTDKNTGKARSRLYIAAENVQMFGGNSGATQNGGYSDPAEDNYYNEYADVEF